MIKLKASGMVVHRDQVRGGHTTPETGLADPVSHSHVSTTEGSDEAIIVGVD
jgi:hypothetical protein